MAQSKSFAWRGHVVFVGLIIGFGVSSVRAADSSQRALSLDEAVAYGLAESVAVKEVDAAFAAQLAEALGTELRPNPELGAEFASPFAIGEERGDNEYAVQVSQILRPSDFGLRRRVSALIREEASVQKRFALIEFTQDISLEFIKLWTLQQKAEVLRAARSRTMGIRSMVSHATKQGLLPLGDEKVFLAEERKLAAELLGLTAEQERATAAFQRLSGLNLSGRILARPAKRPVPTGEAIRSSVRSGLLPIQARSDAVKQLAEQQLDLANTDASPTITPTVGYSHTDAGNDEIVVGFSLPLPFSDRNRPERMRRAAEVTAARAQSSYFAGDRFESELMIRATALQRLFEQADTYDRSVVPAMEDALTSIESQFQRGLANVLQIWQAQRELTDARQQAVELHERAFLEQVELTVLMGNTI